VGLFSDEFDRIWSRPQLVDQLLAIWEARQKDQRQRDEWQYQALVMLDEVATLTHNGFVDKDHAVASRLAVRFASASQTEPPEDPVERWNRQNEAMAAAHQREKERREAKKV